LAAQHQKGFEDLSELTDDDKYHLRREHTRTSTGILESFHLISNLESRPDKWHLPKDLYFSIVICSLGSAIQ
jgi:hypothetical protein